MICACFYCMFEVLLGKKIDQLRHPTKNNVFHKSFTDDLFITTQTIVNGLNDITYVYRYTIHVTLRKSTLNNIRPCIYDDEGTTS